MEFKTQFRKPERFLSNPGSPVKILYGPEFDEKGRMNLVEKGRENLYDFIQSFKESVDIHVLLKRFSNGETDVLSQIQGFYGDFSEFYRSTVLPDVQETGSEPRRDNHHRASFRFFSFLRTNALHTWIPERYYRKLPTDKYSAARYGYCSSPGRGHLQI